MTNFQELQEQLIHYPRFRKEAGFATVKGLLDRLGYRDQLPIIHIVGTNGKGSVAAMLTEILGCNGLKVGTFTSPHLVDIRERMVVKGSLMSEERFVKLHKNLEKAIDLHIEEGGDKPTFFEMMFLMAIQHFTEEKVDVVLLEAGIGGLQDTTNVLENRWLNIITSIGMDHQGILGDRIEEVASQKAGIIREGIKTLALWDKDQVFQVIQRINVEKKGILIPVLPFNGNIAERSPAAIDFSLETKYYNYERLRIHSGGLWQLNNAKLAIMAAHELANHIQIDPRKVAEGIRKFQWPGRLEFIEPWLIVDGAHNLDGMKALASYLNEQTSFDQIIMLFASMADKDYKAMCQTLLTVDKLAKVYLPDLPYLRAADSQIVSEAFKGLGFDHIDTVKDLEAFLQQMSDEVGARTLVCAAGSLYLVGEIKQIQRRTLT